MLVGSDWVQGAARRVYICSRDHKLEEEERSPCVAVWRDDRASHLPTARAEYMDAFFFYVLLQLRLKGRVEAFDFRRSDDMSLR
jgi:hypothetical protein